MHCELCSFGKSPPPTPDTFSRPGHPRALFPESLSLLCEVPLGRGVGGVPKIFSVCQLGEDIPLSHPHPASCVGVVVWSPFWVKHLVVVRYRQPGPDVPVPCSPLPACPPPHPPTYPPPLPIFVPPPPGKYPLCGQSLLLKIEQNNFGSYERSLKALLRKKFGCYSNSSLATISAKRSNKMTFRSLVAQAINEEICSRAIEL